MEVTAPGVHQMTDAEYHADPVPGGSLSRSEAKQLLECPARFAWERQHGRKPRREWDIGHAAHKLILGSGPDLVRVDADEWRSKAVKADVAAIREAGGVPLRPSDFDTVHAMADKLREHPIARRLFDRDHGQPEQTLIWHGSDVWLRARLDWLPDPKPDGRMVIPDYKTCDTASPAAIRKAVASYAYHLQDAWYSAAVDNVLGVAPAFVFVFQEKAPPYLVTVAQLDDEAKDAGHRAMSAAIEIWRQCTESGIWPGYVGDAEIPEISLPPWTDRYEEYA